MLASTCASLPAYTAQARRLKQSPAAAVYHRHDDDYAPFRVAVLTVTADGITRITLFGEPHLVARCQPPPA